MACSMDCKIEITHHFEVLSLKALVSVVVFFTPCSPFCNTNVTRVKCSNFCTSKFLVMKSNFYTSKYLVMKSGFLHFKVFVQKFTLHHTDGPHHMMPPQHCMISAQHWYTVQKELHTDRVLCSCQSLSRHQICLRGVRPYS